MSLAERIRLILTLVFFFTILFSLPLVCGHGHSHDHDHSHGHSEEAPSFKYSKQANEAFQEENTKESHQKHKEDNEISSDRWLEAMGSTLLISITPYLILFIIPVSNSKEHEPYLKVLLAFASGGLLGDAFLHLIPHALMANEAHEDGAHSHSHSHSHAHSHGEEEDSMHSHGIGAIVGVYVLAGIIVFLVVEKFVRIFKGGHGHSHSKPTNKSNSTNSSNESKKTKKTDSKKNTNKSGMC